MGTNCTHPAWTLAAWPPVTPLVAVADARNWIGIYGDTSLDTEIKSCLNSAIEKVASVVGYRVSDTAITDYFPRSATTKLCLSEPGVDRETLAIKYTQAGGEVITVESSKYYLDPTSERVTVTWMQGEAPTDLSTEAENPIQAEYKSKLANLLDAPTVDRVKYAVRVALNWYWQSRGQLQDPHLLDKSLTSLLQSCKIDPAGY